MVAKKDSRELRLVKDMSVTDRFIRGVAAMLFSGFGDREKDSLVVVLRHIHNFISF